jgi:Ribbon-helix-helix protein, copG family
MRTTLTLDDDLALQLERLRRARNTNMKDLVNEALRRGLRDMGALPKKRPAFRTRAFHRGKPLINIVERLSSHSRGQSGRP